MTAASVLNFILEPVLFLLGAVLLVTAVRWWRPALPPRAGLAYGILVAAFFAAPLFTGALQIPTDLAYHWLPWRDMVPGRPPILVNGLQIDTLAEELPFHALVHARLRRLEAPLWSHEMGAGQPLLGNSQSSPFAPLHLLALPLPAARALTVTAAWEMLLALLLMHALLLRLGAGGAGAAFGAVAVALSTYMTVWAYDPLAGAAAWFLGVLLGMVLLRHGERWSFPGLVVCALGLASSGQPETMGYAALISAMVAAVLALDPAPGRRRFVLRLLTAGALTACLSAPILLPVVEQLPRSQRMRDVKLADVMQPPRFEPRLALPTLDPLVFGSPRDHNWAATSNYNELCSGYAGLVTLAVALAGALAFRGRIAAILLAGLAALLAALRISPLFDMIHTLPVVGQGATGRLRLFWVLAVAIAGGLSVGRLAADRRPRTAGAVLLLAAGTALATLPPPGGAVWQTAWWITVLGGTALTLGALLLPGARRWFPRVALAALLLDLFLLEARFQPVPAQELDLSPPPALAFLIDRARRSPEPFRVLADDYDLYPNTAAIFGLWDPRGRDPMHPFDSSRFERRRLRSQDKALRLSAESYMAVRYRLMAHRRHLAPPWQPVLNGAGGKVWENPEAYPLFFMPRHFLRTSEDGVFRQVLSWQGIQDFHDLGVAAGGHGEASPQEGTVREIRPGSNRFDMEVDSPTGGVVVSSISYAPGWQEEIGGGRSPAFEVNSAFLGFRVPPGVHAVHLFYRPVGWTAGLVLFALGATAALAGGLAAGYRSQLANRRQ